MAGQVQLTVSTVDFFRTPMGQGIDLNSSLQSLEDPDIPAAIAMMAFPAADPGGKFRQCAFQGKDFA